jgi:hypothetical protein
METTLTPWNWLEEAKKLGYTLASEERERAFTFRRILQFPLPWEISAED